MKKKHLLYVFSVILLLLPCAKVFAQDKSFTLTKTDSESARTITQYTISETINYYDPLTGELVSDSDRQNDVDYIEAVIKQAVPEYYIVDLNRSEYGNPNGKTVLSFDESIKYKYNPSDFSEVISNTLDKGTITNPTGTLDNPYIIQGGAGYQNPQNGDVSLENILFLNNKTSVHVKLQNSKGTTYTYGGGAVFNEGKISDMSGAFVGNTVELTTESNNNAYAAINFGGGALYNLGEIDNITSDFIGNYIFSTPYSKGGAVYNDKGGTIGVITGNFIGNYVNNGNGFGGAIYNDKANIGVINGDFIKNYVISPTSIMAKGGAIFNAQGTIDDINSNFTDNYVTAQAYVWGGAIENDGTIGNIKGDFLGNHAVSYDDNYSIYHAKGGAIYNNGNDAHIESITGDFIGNYVSTASSSSVTNKNVYYSGGGAIMNYSSSGTVSIGDINGNFTKNYAFSNGAFARGGAIANFTNNDWQNGTLASIGNIKGNFVENYVLSNLSDTQGGAIFNASSKQKENVTIGNVTGDFINNHANAPKGNAYGGAIYNYSYYNGSSTIGDIKGNFIGNYVSSDSLAYGGAIYNYSDYNNTTSRFGDIEGDFIGNYARSENSTASGGAIYNDARASLANSIIGDIKGNFTGNYAKALSNALGGAINNNAEIKDIIGDFTGNYVMSSEGSAKGGAIYNSENIGDINGNFVGNYAVSDENEAYGGAINNTDDIDNINGNFIGNYVSAKYDEAKGGAIYNNEDIGDINGNFVGNHASNDEEIAYGGAIYNKEEIGNIKGNFSGNYVYSKEDDSLGGAIYNNDTIQDINGDFSNNYAMSSEDYAKGGAIYNTDRIGNIKGDFKDNFAMSKEYSVYGGAIYNDGSIKSGSYNIPSENKINVNVYGTTYYNKDTGENFTVYQKISDEQMKEINERLAKGDKIVPYYSSSYNELENDSYISNKENLDKQIENGTYTKVFPLGQFNESDIALYDEGSIVSDFYNNYAKSEESNAYGGAIYNIDKLGRINGTFSGNYVDAYSNAYGGAIYNTGTIGTYDVQDYKRIEISVNVETYINMDTGEKFTVYNKISGAELSSIKEQIANGSKMVVTYSKSTSEVLGSNWESCKNSLDSSVQDGYLSYDPPLKDFVDNDYAKLAGSVVNSSFYNNYAKSQNGIAKGGAIYTTSDFTITADNGESIFKGNYTESNRVKIPNAVYVDSDSVLTLNVVNNGTIKFYDQIDGIHGYKLSLTGDSTGTVSLYNEVLNADVTAVNLTIDFANNETKDYSFNTLTSAENTKYNIDIDLTNEKADTITVQNPSSGIITLNMINYIGSNEDKFKVQILKTPDSNLQLAFGDNIHVVDDVLTSVGNTVYNDDIFMQEEGLTLGTTDTANDSVIVQKDKIYDTLQVINQKVTNEERNFTFHTTDGYFVSKDIGETSTGTLNINGLSSSTPSYINANGHSLFDLKNATTLNISNVVIQNAQSQTGSVINAENNSSSVNLTNVSMQNNSSSNLGGAIFSNVDIDISANKGNSFFLGNTANGESNAIYLNDSSKTLKLSAVDRGTIVFNDKIDGEAGYTLKIDGDSTSSVGLNNNVSNANIVLNNTNLYLGKDDVFNNSSSLTLNSGSMSMMNNSAGTMHIPAMNLNGNTNLSVDVNLAGASMDRITADSYSIADGAKLNVSNLNLLNDARQNVTTILFADSGLSNAVQYTGSKNVAYSPIWKYDVSYGVNPDSDQGFFTFAIGGSGGSDSYNPSVLTTPVATQSGAYTTQMQTLSYAFQHSDNFMAIPYLERFAMKNTNRYALSPTGDATDVGVFSPIFTKEEQEGFWVKPYASFENIPLKNGPKVSNINYGTLIGHDSNLTPIAHGFDRVLTAYIGYNGASQRYSGMDTYQNGGILGGTTTFYKGNFFNATTLSVGASAGNSSGMYGSENYTMLLAGIGNKTGYNFEFLQGRLILQPNFLISYTFVNTFDYTNAAGLRIKSDPLNAIQLSPGIKLIANTKNGWQPYIGVNMVWNLMDESKVTANDVRLPEMSIKPYVQYGVGVQKRFQDRFTAYLQAMIHNGGRNGVSLSGGFRWQVGKK